VPSPRADLGSRLRSLGTFRKNIIGHQKSIGIRVSVSGDAVRINARETPKLGASDQTKLFSGLALALTCLSAPIHGLPVALDNRQATKTKVSARSDDPNDKMQ